jgi:DNA repair protein RadC
MAERESNHGSDGARVEYRLRMADIPEGERPRERFKQIGASGASQRELLAILLRNGPVGDSSLDLADTLLNQFGGLAGLARASLEDLQRVYGVGEVKALEIKAAMELGKRMALAAPEQKTKIGCPADAAQILMLEMGLLDQEEIRTMLLDTHSRVLGIPLIYRGTLNSASLRVGEVFKPAIRANCASMIVAHNHPSQDRALRSA